MKVSSLFRFFHSFEDSSKQVIKSQGFLVGVEPGTDGRFFRLQLFSWVDGERICQRVVPADHLQLLDFYADAEQMNAEWRKRGGGK